MRSEQEIKQLKEELEKLTCFITDHGTADQFNSKDLQFACNICDALIWVLSETPTEGFKSDAFLSLDQLKQIVSLIETTTGKKLTNYH